MPLSKPAIKNNPSSIQPAIGKASGTKSAGETVYITANIKGIQGFILDCAGLFFVY